MNSRDEQTPANGPGQQSTGRFVHLEIVFKRNKYVAQHENN